MALGTEATWNSSSWPSLSLTKPGPVQDGVPPGVTRRSTTSSTWPRVSSASHVRWSRKGRK